MFYKNDKLGLFVDGPNFNSSCKQLGFTPDFGRIRDEFAARSQLMASVFITALRDGDDGTNMLTDWLSYNGWQVITKTAKNVAGKPKMNMDIELALEMVRRAEHMDHMVLFSGDGDFAPLVRYLQERGVRVTGICGKPNTADDLRRQVDDFVHLEDLADTICRKRT